MWILKKISWEIKKNMLNQLWFEKGSHSDFQMTHIRIFLFTIPSGCKRAIAKPHDWEFQQKMIHSLRTESCFTYKIKKIGQIVVVRTISTPKKYAIFQQLMQLVLVNAILHFPTFQPRPSTNRAASWERKKSDFRKKKLIFDVLKFWPNSMSSNIWIR